MKINKKFIDLLLQKREAPVYYLLNEEGLNYFIEKEVKKLPLHKYNRDSLEPIEDIIYTINFLIKEGLVEKTAEHSPAIPDFGEVMRDVYRFHYIEEEFKKVYGLMLKVKLGLFDYKRRGYKTEKQRQEDKNTWLPIIVAIIAASLTALLTFLLNKYV